MLTFLKDTIVNQELNDHPVHLLSVQFFTYGSPYYSEFLPTLKAKVGKKNYFEGAF